MKHKKKIEFSKVIFVGVSILTVYVVALSTFMMILTHDLTPLAYLIPSVFAETAAATGFYYNKAKAENKIKLMKENNIEITTSHFKEDYDV